MKSYVKVCKFCSAKLRVYNRRIGNPGKNRGDSMSMVMSKDGVYVLHKIWLCNSCFNSLWVGVIHNINLNGGSKDGFK